MHSALYVGRLRHRRHLPRQHAFEYRLFMVYLDLAELHTIFRGRWLWSTRRPALAWLRRADYLGDRAVPLDAAVRDCVAQRMGVRPAGPIRILTHLRCFGYCLNPVTFYYCFDSKDSHVEIIVAEITNTPWGERHVEVLTPAMNEGSTRFARFRFGKSFHVSPFMPMDIDYAWRFGAPGDRLTVHMASARNGTPLFDATLTLARREITSGSLALTLARFPLMTWKVVAGIYVQALCLYLKRTPFYAYPKTVSAGDVDAKEKEPAAP